MAPSVQLFLASANFQEKTRLELLNDNIYLLTLAVGLSCSTSCGQVSVFFMGSWISGSESNSKKGLISVLYFLCGKASIYIVLAVLSSFIGTELQQLYSRILGDRFYVVFYSFLIAFGIYCVASFFREAHCKTCNGTNQRKHFEITPGKALLAGLAFGITPCYPMTVLMINSSMSSLSTALFLGIIFALTSFVNPLLIVGLISGKVSFLMNKEIFQYVKYFQLCFSVGFVLIGVFSLIKEFM